MSCKIFRDFDTEEVTKVLAPNGADSKLYADALAITEDQEQALNIWSAAYIPTFKARYGDWEGTNTFIPLNETIEPPIDVVMDFINTNNVEEKLSVKEAVDVLKVMQLTGLQPEGVALKLKFTFFNSKGQFVIDRQRLERSGIYTEEEINNLMNYPSVRQGVKDTISKLRNTLKEEVTMFGTVIAEDTSDHPLHIYTAAVDSLGRQETLPISEVETYVVNNIGQFVTEEEFQSKLNRLEREDIRDAILNTPEAIDYVRSLVQNLKSVPVLSERDGVIVQKMLNDSYETLKNTLTVNVDKLDFTKSVDTLRAIPDDMWTQEVETIQSFLKDTEIEAAKVGLDLEGLSESYFTKSKEEVVGFLDLVDDFNIKTEEYYGISNADLVEFSNDLNEFFGKQDQPDMRAIAVPDAYKNRNLVILDHRVSEVDAYRTNGLIKVVGDIYQQVDPFQNYYNALSATYDAVRQDVTILPKEAFSDFGLKQGYYDVKAIVNPLNRDKVVNSINNFVQRNTYSSFSFEEFFNEDTSDPETPQEITLMKALFNPVKIKDQYTNDVAERTFSFTGDVQYLTSDFITDFYSRILEEKIVKGKSDLWNIALRHFQIGNKGIEVKPLSADTLAHIKMALQSEPILYTNLVNYALISKNESLEFLKEFSDEVGINDIQARRDFTINNPDSIDHIPVSYMNVGMSSMIVQNFNDEFTKNYDGIFELTSSDNGVSVYSKVFGRVDRNYYLFGEASPTVEDIDAQSYMKESPELFVETSHGISTKTLNESQENISCTI